MYSRNFYVDTSSALYALKPDHAVELIRAFGAGRVMFGTDYPMWSPEKELAYFFSLGFSEEENRRMLSGNVRRLFGI